MFKLYFYTCSKFDDGDIFCKPWYTEKLFIDELRRYKVFQG